MKIVFALPFAIMAGGMFLISLFQWYISLPLVFCFFWLMYYPLMLGYLLGNNATLPIMQTPFMSAILIATVAFGFVDWIRWLPCIPRVFLTIDSSTPIGNIVMMMSLSLLGYAMFKTVGGDPGYIKAETHESRQQVLISLADSGKLDSRHYCITCGISRPVRSKHCRDCKRCVGKMDHHCPWTFNCIGAGNHRVFMIFLATLCTTAWSYVYVATSCI
jgi:hypothetical protein